MHVYFGVKITKNEFLVNSALHPPLILTWQETCYHNILLQCRVTKVVSKIFQLVLSWHEACYSNIVCQCGIIIVITDLAGNKLP